MQPTSAAVEPFRYRPGGSIDVRSLLVPGVRSRGPCVSLRVAVLAPVAWRVPPRHYGPWEQFASLLTEGLVARGLDATLFATRDSITGARLVGTVPTGYAEDETVDAKVSEALHISSVFERAWEFDVIHN